MSSHDEQPTEDLTEEEKAILEEQKIAALKDKIRYSEPYSDDENEHLYRNVTLPKGLLKYIPKELWGSNGALKILTEEQCREIGVLQSNGWEHYEVHAPEPQILLFRRPVGSYGAQQNQRYRRQ